MFSVFLKFDESLGEKGLARDYSVLGEENFEEIIKRYKESFTGRYATREDLGGVGNVDYLICPFLYRDGGAKCILALAELGDVYYAPINLVASYGSIFGLDAYNLQYILDEHFLDAVAKTYFRNISELQSKTNNIHFGIDVLKNSYLNLYVPSMLQYKKEFLNNFEDIAKYRSDLFFTENGLAHHLTAFLASKGITIIDQKQIENILPSFLRYISTIPDKKLDKTTLGISKNKESFHIFFKRGDVFFDDRNFVKRLSGISLVLERCFYGSIEKFEDRTTAFQTLDFNTFKLKVDLVKSIKTRYPKSISTRLTYIPTIDTETKTSDVEIEGEVISIGEDGFVKVEQLDTSFLPDKEFLFNRLFNEKPSLLQGSPNDPIYHVIELDSVNTEQSDPYSGLTNVLDVPETIFSDTPDKFHSENWLIDYHHKVKTLSNRGKYRESHKEKRRDNPTGYITDFFMDFAMYSEDKVRIRGLAKDFIEKYSEEKAILERTSFMFSFYTKDLSLSLVAPSPATKYSWREDNSYMDNPFLKVRRDEEGYLIIETLTAGIDEADIVSLYKEVIDYAFFLQKKLVEKYGRIEYILELFVVKGYWRPSYRNMFLLTEDGEVVQIHESHF